LFEMILGVQEKVNISLLSWSLILMKWFTINKKWGMKVRNRLMGSPKLALIFILQSNLFMWTCKMWKIFTFFDTIMPYFKGYKKIGSGRACHKLSMWGDMVNVSKWSFLLGTCDLNWHLFLMEWTQWIEQWN